MRSWNILGYVGRDFSTRQKCIADWASYREIHCRTIGSGLLLLDILMDSTIRLSIRNTWMTPSFVPHNAEV